MADVDDNIGYFPLQMMPKRSSFYAGTIVSRGWLAENEWNDETVAQEDIPYVINPKKGFILTANNRVSEQDTFRKNHM